MLSNVTIVKKSLAAPLVAAMIVGLIVLQLARAYSEVNGSMRRAEEAADAANLARQVLLKTTASVGALFRTVSWRAANVEQGLVGESKKTFTEAVSGAAEDLRQLGKDLHGVNSDALAQAGERLDDYRKAAAQAVDAVDQDPLIATMLMTDVYDKAKAADEKLKIVVDDASSFERDENAATKRLLERSLSQLYLGAAIAIVSILLINGLLAAMIVLPIRSITSVMSRLAQGELETDLPSTDRGDEIGEMARAIRVFKENAASSQLLAQEREHEAAHRSTRVHSLESAMKSFEAKVGDFMTGLRRTALDLNASSAHMVETVNAVGAQSSMASKATESAAVSVAQVATAAEQLSASVLEIRRQVEVSGQTADSAVSDATRTAEKMRSLESAVGKVNKIIAMIKVIAHQTDLLALNATIEAARAGEAGKGFAIVASEVKALATQTANATEEIVKQISEIQAATVETAEAVGGIGRVIGEMSAISDDIASTLNQQDVATQEIAKVASEAASATEDASRSVRSGSNAVRGSAQTAEQVSRASQGLNADAEALQQVVAAFLEEVRVA